MTIPQSNSDVFEMIIRAAAAPEMVVESTPSDVLIPEDWHEEHQEGQLAVDVLDAGSHLVVISTIAGAVADKIEVYLHNDLLTIRGERRFPLYHESNQKVENSPEISYIYQECFWGHFSRTLVLPVDVKREWAKAEYKNGILTISIPKCEREARIPVVIVD